MVEMGIPSLARWVTGAVAWLKPFGHQECEEMSPGVCSAPKAFQRIIALILEGFQAAEIRMNAVFNLD